MDLKRANGIGKKFLFSHPGMLLELILLRVRRMRIVNNSDPKLVSPKIGLKLRSDKFKLY